MKSDIKLQNMFIFLDDIYGFLSIKNRDELLSIISENKIIITEEDDSENVSQELVLISDLIEALSMDRTKYSSDILKLFSLIKTYHDNKPSSQTENIKPKKQNTRSVTVLGNKTNLIYYPLSDCINLVAKALSYIYADLEIDSSEIYSFLKDEELLDEYDLPDKKLFDEYYFIYNDQNEEGEQIFATASGFFLIFDVVSRKIFIHSLKTKTLKHLTFEERNLFINFHSQYKKGDFF